MVAVLLGVIAIITVGGGILIVGALIAMAKDY